MRVSEAVVGVRWQQALALEDRDGLTSPRLSPPGEPDRCHTLQRLTPLNG